MDVRIGVTYSPKELDIEVADEVADELRASIEETLGSGQSVLWIEDRRGKRVGIPADKVAYVELGPRSDDRRIGFGAS